MRKLIFLFALILTVATSLKSETISFKASAPQAVAMGQQFRISYIINADAKELRAPEFKDFDVLMGPTTSTSISQQIFNGNFVSETTLTFTYVLMPKQEGTFNIPPATIKVKNSTYTSNALSVKVLPADERSGNTAAGSQSSESTSNANDAFVRMEVSKRSVYEQESFLVTFKLYCVNGARVTDVKFPEFEGFLAQEIKLPDNQQWSLERSDGKNYRTVVLKQTVLFPQRSGQIRIDRGTFKVAIPIMRETFNPFEDRYYWANKELFSAPVTIDVKPLPSGKPDSFSGVVGNFTMDASISSNNIKANEAVTVKVKISGTGNIRLAKNPEVKFPNDFEIYDPKVETNSNTTTSGVSGSKTIEYMAIPRFGGDFEIPAVKFSYFDTNTNTYKTLSSEPFKLHVEKGEGGSATAPIVSNFSNREQLKVLGQDIRFLKIKNINFVPVSDMFFGTILYVMCYVIPAILFVVFFFIYRKQVKENSDLALVRTKKANKTAVRRLKNAGNFLKENKKEEFYDEVLRALWGYLSDKLNISLSNLTKDNVEIELNGYGVDEVLIKDFLSILNTCEFARYAPSQASDAMDKLYEQTVDAIGKMENTIKK